MSRELRPLSLLVRFGWSNPWLLSEVWMESGLRRLVFGGEEVSAPTKGMVAGKAIKTGDLSKEYEEGHARIFGERTREKGRFVYREGLGMVRVGDDWTDADRRAQTATEELVYGNAKATDGTPINTRKRHREYLQHNGLAMMGDYSDAYHEKNARSRERADDKQRREVIERAFHKSRGY